MHACRLTADNLGLLYLWPNKRDVKHRGKKYIYLGFKFWTFWVLVSLVFRPHPQGGKDMVTLKRPHVLQCKPMQMVTWLLSLQNQESVPLSPDPFSSRAWWDLGTRLSASETLLPSEPRKQPSGGSCMVFDFWIVGARCTIEVAPLNNYCTYV
jgi:hypothetical protein